MQLNSNVSPRLKHPIELIALFVGQIKLYCNLEAGGQCFSSKKLQVLQLAKIQRVFFITASLATVQEMHPAASALLCI